MARISNGGGGGGSPEDEQDQSEGTVRRETRVSRMPAAEPGEPAPERTEFETVSESEVSVSEFREDTGRTGGDQNQDATANRDTEANPGATEPDPRAGDEARRLFRQRVREADASGPRRRQTRGPPSRRPGRARGEEPRLTRDDVERSMLDTEDFFEVDDRDRPEERFGDVVIPVGGGARLEDVLRGGAEEFSGRLEDVTADREQADEGDIVLESAIAAGLEASGREELATDVEDFERSVVRGAGEIVNVPATALGLKEGFEFIGAGGAAVARGQGEEFAGRSAEAGERAIEAFAQQARDKPVETGAFVGGALLGSTAAIAGASRVSSRGGRAAAFAIQPGEELIGRGGARVTRAAAGQRAADTLFPQGEPLVFSEEAAIRRTKQTVRRARATKRRSQRLLRGEESLGLSPRQRRTFNALDPREATGRDPDIPADRPDLLRAEDVDVRTGAREPQSVIEDMLPQDAAGGPFAVGLSKTARARAVETELDFDPGRSEVLGGGASEVARQEMVRRQIAMRRELGGEFEGEVDPIGRTQFGRTRQRFDSETETETDQRTDVLVRTEFDTPTAQDTDQPPRQDQPPQQDQPPKQDQPPRQDPEVEPEAEPEPESEVETEPIFRPESEVEPEAETEFEAESEVEADPFVEPRQRRRRPSRDRRFDAFERTFETRVAAPEAVLSGVDFDDGELEADEDSLKPLGVGATGGEGSGLAGLSDIPEDVLDDS